MEKSRKYNLPEYTDSNWCKDKDDQKLMAGYSLMFGETSISWCLKKELVVTLSSCKVGYITALLCVCPAVWLKNILKEIGNEEGELVTLVVEMFLL